MSWNTPQAATSVDVVMNRYAMLTDNNIVQQWQAAQKALADVKEREMELRQVVAKRLFPNPDKGTQRVDLSGEAAGYTVKLVHKLNYKLPGKKENAKIYDIANQIRNVSALGSFIIERLVSWEADISVSEYNKLTEDAATGSGDAIAIRKLIDSILTISPAAPTLELEETKNK